MRANDSSTDELLRHALARHVVSEPDAPHPSYSIRIEKSAPEATAQPLHTLYEGGCLIARSRRPEVVLGALVRHLSVHALVAQGATPVRCVVFARADGRAILASAVLRTQAARSANRLASQGLEVVATPAVLLDADGCHAIVPGAVDHVTTDTLAETTQGDAFPLAKELAERRFSVDAWIMASARGDFDPMSRSVAAGLLTQDVMDGAQLSPSFVRAMTCVLQFATPIAAGGLASWEIVDHLSGFASRRRKGPDP